MKPRLFLAVSAAILALCTTAASAMVSYNKETRSLIVTGPTTKFQEIDVWRALNNEEVDTIFLSGPGGEFFTGLSMGRMLAAHGVRVIIPRGKECISACAFIAIGAKDFIIDGELWFHTPYTRIVDPGKSVRQIAADHAYVFLQMTQYLLEMGLGMDFAMRIVKETSTCRFLVMDGDGGLNLRNDCEDARKG